MIAIDYLILNRDRHGANIEILRNARARILRIAPLFDHGLSLLYSCISDEAAMKLILWKTNVVRILLVVTRAMKI